MRESPVETAHTPSEQQATDTITLIEGFDAVRVFLEIVWCRLDNAPEEIAYLMGACRWADGSPVDPTTWEDWLTAVRKSRSVVEDYEANGRAGGVMLMCPRK
jgi:hypothetical protein